MEALKCFMCSSPAAEGGKVLPEQTCASSGKDDFFHDMFSLGRRLELLTAAFLLALFCLRVNLA